MTAEPILVVDDEASIVSLARLYLEREGFKVQSASDGLTAMKAIENLKPALVILDVMLPELDGFEICKKLRAANNPVLVLMLTARDDDIDKILGLELGADDYMTKPFNPRELVARVKALLRRSRVNEAGTGERIQIADLRIDTGSREVTCQNRLIDLRAQEFEVLLALARHKGQVLSREQLLNQAWGFDFSGETRTVDVHIGQIRRKLAGSQVRIETITGVGYKLVG
jgi:two-component system, OmpR family, alkaline phosphatase synthesis response regulator PhoP